MRKNWQKPLAVLLAAAMAVVPFSLPADIQAAKKKGVSLSKKTLQVREKKSKRVKVKNSSGKKIRSVKWKVIKGSSVIKLSKKSKSGVTIKGKKKGTATVRAKIKTGSKTYTRKVKVSVTKPVTKKTLKLSATKLSMKAGNSQKITIKNTTGLTVKSVKWSVTGGSDVVTLSGKSKKSVTVKAVKTGAAILQAKIKTAEGTATRTAGITVTAATSTVQSTELLHYNMTCSADGKKLLDQSGKGNDAELVDVDTTVQKNNSLFLDGGAYIKLPEKAFKGQNTLTISIWLNSYSGRKNTSAMFLGTKESTPASYWLLNTANLEGRMKSVMTDSVNAAAPWLSEIGISPTTAANGVMGPITKDRVWNHYVTVITPDSITGYLNGVKAGSFKKSRKLTDFGDDIVAYIGKSSYNDPTWAGYVREVQVYREAKSETDIMKLYENTKVTDTGSDVVNKGSKTDVFIADRADPYIVKGNDGYYYFTASYPMRGASDTEGYDRIVLRRSKTLDGLKNAEEKPVWDEKDSTTSHRFIWAPEMHYIGGKWYLYYAGSGVSDNTWDINCRVLMCKGDDPYNDEWEEKGIFQRAAGDSFSFTGFSLDMTYFENNGKSYVIWAQKPLNGTSNLYMAEVDPKEPWKATTPAMLLTKPEYYWECQVIPVNEGPSVLIHDGRVIVAYSASATGPEYCLGFMYADAKADLMDIKSWTKQKTAALTSDDLIDEYGPGHNSFTKDEEGNDIFVYHSRGKECYEGRCGYSNGDPLYDPCRSARIRKVAWGENGLPILNQ